MRLAVVGALVSGAVLLPAAPALADVTVSPGGTEFNPGENRQITIRLTGPDAVNPPNQTTITVSNNLNGEVTLTGCGENGRTVLSCPASAFEDNELKVTASAKNPSGLQPGQNREGTISVRAGNENAGAVEVRVNGPQQAASVTEVTGKVVNQSTGDPVANAQVTLKDSANNEHNATANARGDFRFTAQGNKPIAAGQLTLTATFEGFAEGTANANGVAGRATNGVQIRMKPEAASTPPSAPAAAEPPSEEPSANATDLAQPSNTSGESGGPSLLSWLLIGMGVVLVLLGVGAIVLLVMRRKDGDDTADDYGEPGPNHLAPVGAAAGGAYRGSDRTMVAGSPGMNDATAIVGPQQQLDEFPDPYAAPAPTRAGYGGGYGADQATSVAPGPGYGRGGYGDEAGYGRGEPGYSNGGGYRDERGYESPRGGGGYADDPRSGGGAYGGGGGSNGYGGGGGGYGDSPRGRYADEPTGHYPASGGGGYPPAGYGGDAGGRGAGGPANGYGPGGGAGGPASGYGPGGGGYEDAPRGGGDYGRGGGGGYPSAGGYERPPGDYADRGGDPRNGRGRNVDWLD
jgi:hypothetical protein